MAEKTSASKDLRPRLDLAAFRQSKGITLDQIAETTKITKRFLRAIEDGDFDKLPGGIFNTSYIRQYAHEIGYDEADLLEYYNLRMGVHAPEDEHASQKKKPVSKAHRLAAMWARF